MPKSGQIVDRIKRNPYSIILFDEIEKAHPDIFNILLQVLDEGRLTDSQGRTVDFKNTIIILTSNLGSDLLSHQSNDQDESETKNAVMNVVRAHFRPEFLNRLDEIILFHRLNRDHMSDIVKIQLGLLEGNLKQQNIGLTYDDKALEWLGDHGFDPIYGARPLKRTIQRELQNSIAKLLLAGDVTSGDVISLSAKDNKIVIGV